ncbi:nucleoside recognition domain-containing protein [Paenibacillus sp. CF384]|uniref:nucleoside recognition domain-containing protein n=1 Tax=Paenibacillus sp. CF384 TaxID=1884382 RepID=UPI000898C4EC|nr:nucleoside recognition domain-containing protein [Paenibacillus sp. CF384]SDW28698.1 sporulation integral membrane protein YlbJ [Paenibacillus sp. CF384]
MTRSIMLACLSILLVASIILRPGEAFQASLQGLTVWWNLVFPGLLPFLTLLELMLAFGTIHGFGALLQPLMRKLFRLPGEAGIAIALGWSGGFPCGAETTAALRRSETVTAQEGQRLLALTHMPSPLFMLLVVGAGFLKQPAIGAAIAAAVWVSALLTAFLHARFTKHRSAASSKPIQPSESASLSTLLKQAAVAMQAARKRDGRTFGKALGDSVTVSVYKLMAIGGFMMFGAVLVKLAQPLLPQGTPAFLLPGLIESHIGTYAAASSTFTGGLPWNAAAIAAVLSFGGLSALLQAGSAITGTGLSLKRLAATRLFQSLLAFILTLAAWNPMTSLLGRVIPSAAPAMLQTEKTGAASNAIIRAGDLHSLWPYTPVLLVLFLFILLALLIASMLAAPQSKTH